MKQRFTLILLMALSCAMVFAGPVDLEQARGKAAKFMKKHNGAVVVLSDTPEYAPARTIRGVATNSETPAYYVFNTEGENGYVIVSGDDRTDEILGYSTNGTFDIENMPENVKAWLQGYAEQIALLETYVPQSQNVSTYNNQWNAITPLTTTKWNQGAPYNDKCPLDSDTKSVTGCTATAMAQIMKYHEWPQESTSKIPYYITTTSKLKMPRLAATTFRWDEMKDSYSSDESADAVAELMLYCGQAIKSDYTKLGTGAFTGDVVTALQNYFDYDVNLELKNIYFYTISEWESIVYNELSEGRPVYHAGYSMAGGHAFVCDGYDGNGKFHFNWGWGGSHDGYYKLALLTPGTGGIGSGSSDGYSMGQEIIIGIQAPTGEAEKPRYFTPHSEQVIDNTMYSYFYNTHAKSLTANVGFATIDENNNIIKVLKDCGAMTLKGSMSETNYAGINLANDGLVITRGTHRIATVCRPSGSSVWKRIGSYQNYFEVTVGTGGAVTNIVQHPVTSLTLTSFTPTGNLVAGMPQNCTLSLENKGDEVYTAYYLYASPTEEMGEAQSRAIALMKKGETTDLYLSFTPETYGAYNLWLSNSSTASENYILKTTVNISKAPSKPSNLSLVSCVPDKKKVSASVRVKNNSTEPYCREIVAILLEDLYSDGRFYGTEVLSLPGDIASGATKSFNFQFHGADSYSQCAIFVGYYANHTDGSYSQLGDFIFFTTEETPVESIMATPVEGGPVYRMDGTKVAKPMHDGIYISNGKKMVVK